MGEQSGIDIPTPTPTPTRELPTVPPDNDLPDLTLTGVIKLPTELVTLDKPYSRTEPRYAPVVTKRALWPMTVRVAPDGNRSWVYSQRPDTIENLTRSDYGENFGYATEFGQLCALHHQRGVHMYLAGVCTDAQVELYQIMQSLATDPVTCGEEWSLTSQSTGIPHMACSPGFYYPANPALASFPKVSKGDTQ